MDTNRYARHLILKEIGGAGQQALAAARVAIIGAGALGNACAQYLVAAGVGQKIGEQKGALALFDGDKIETSNLARQILFSENDIGKSKTQTAARVLQKQNSQCNIIAHKIYINKNNISMLDNYEIIADASDNFASRFLLADYCAANNKILVAASCARFDGQIATFKEGAPHYRDFVPPEMETQTEEDCATLGILGAVAGVVGCLQAVEIIKEITAAGTSLAGHILIYDGLAATTRRVRLTKNEIKNEN